MHQISEHSAVEKTRFLPFSEISGNIFILITEFKLCLYSLKNSLQVESENITWYKIIYLFM